MHRVNIFPVRPNRLGDRTFSMPDVVDIDALEPTPYATVFDEPPTIRLQLEAGVEIAPHTHPGMDVVCYLLERYLKVGVNDETFELSAGEADTFSCDRQIAPSAPEDATAVLVFVPV